MHANRLIASGRGSTSIKVEMAPIWAFWAPLIRESLAFGLAGPGRAPG